VGRLGMPARDHLGGRDHEEQPGYDRDIGCDRDQGEQDHNDAEGALVQMVNSHPNVKSTFGASSCSRCSTTDARMGAFASGNGVGFSSASEGQSMKQEGDRATGFRNFVALLNGTSGARAERRRCPAPRMEGPGPTLGE
jgi:hypothetical protein